MKSDVEWREFWVQNMRLKMVRMEDHLDYFDTYNVKVPPGEVVKAQQVNKSYLGVNWGFTDTFHDTGFVCFG